MIFMAVILPLPHSCEQNRVDKCKGRFAPFYKWNLNNKDINDLSANFQYNDWGQNTVHIDLDNENAFRVFETEEIPNRLHISYHISYSQYK